MSAERPDQTRVPDALLASVSSAIARSDTEASQASPAEDRIAAPARDNCGAREGGKPQAKQVGVLSERLPSEAARTSAPTPAQQEPGPVPARRWWLLLLLGLTFLLLSVVIFPLVWLMVSGRADLARAISADDAYEPGWRYRDLVASIRLVPEAENGWPVVEGLARSWPPPPNVRLTKSSEWLKEIYGIHWHGGLPLPGYLSAFPSAIVASGRCVWHERLPTDVAKELEEIMAAAPHVWPALQYLSHFPGLQCPVPGSVPEIDAHPRLSPANHLGIAFCLAVLCLEWHLQHGRFQDAERCLHVLCLMESAYCDRAFCLPWRNWSEFWAVP
ncbi:MAG: hypothetical protein RMI91_00455 [Gemmatales bacterium]|nr:hypothetical protein [Gemmatales bacterium]MDW7993102.1 hypothetical protein [Gemmatales bacterium]